MLSKINKNTQTIKKFGSLAWLLFGGFTSTAFVYASEPLTGIESETLSQYYGQVSVNRIAYSVLEKAKAQGRFRENSIRDKLVYSYGLRVGQQYGYAEQLQQLQNKINDKGTTLDQIFNFNAILALTNTNQLATNLVPPVLLKAKDYVSNPNANTIEIAEHYYEIYAQAYLTERVPTWRNYLIQGIPRPQKIPDSYLPKDSHEQAVWQKALSQGWALGIEQADREMLYRINRLSRDYNGMITYLILYAKNKVNAPLVAYARQSVVGSGDALSVNADRYQITSKAALVVNPTAWQFSAESPKENKSDKNDKNDKNNKKVMR
ncbi:type IV secretory system conjugative DNA transfer family protein [Cysteiniphilum marinum]|uniref:type IV secretory system conjugative DNA transfer family protein n=1 Tax=Cysteiniphilum marinum TaxID=2774191 RepID=UPI00193AE75C|nr:type IV secretory system conjugative DNA transfer family protein [Cysteiniphilum marinum]